jgi:hypothetical protein
MASASGGNWQDPSSNAQLMKQIRAEIAKRERRLAK